MSKENQEEISNVFYIPNNYTDSGRVLGGMFDLRNLIEAAILGAGLGYLMWNLIPVEPKLKIIIIFLVDIPISLLALIGYQGDCITRVTKNLFIYLRDRRKLRYRRIQKDVTKTTKQKTKTKSS